MARTHRYTVDVSWTGNLGTGTSGYREFSRDHEVSGPGKPVLPGSSDPAFRGDPSRYNPEELLVAALSQCHMLWFLHLASANGVVVTGYTDHPEGTMAEGRGGGGEFTEVLLRPEVTVAEPGMLAGAEGLHEQAHTLCFIARSVNFPVHHQPSTTAAAVSTG
ncbi:MAG TPA: OsmC family protein [Pseudonocardia sp.]|uniref:OsmC family protein n=1 Tax=Pseudonocardia sp. TaxID=60912 RepID=UPI002C03B416|nr:OsmC family protein [Pseudonocardia sp.]HTF46891.1 OsmC family protein [Pseudonocardia sp.]